MLRNQWSALTYIFDFWWSSMIPLKKAPLELLVIALHHLHDARIICIAGNVCRGWMAILNATPTLKFVLNSIGT